MADDDVQGSPGSFHMYGLTNQKAAPPSDFDEDGLPDSWEIRIVDNLEDLNGNGAGPGPGSGTGDFDGDGLTDLDEYEETGTDPTKADTDEESGDVSIFKYFLKYKIIYKIYTLLLFVFHTIKKILLLRI